jgi:hypothetical protein
LLTGMGLTANAQYQPRNGPRYYDRDYDRSGEHPRLLDRVRGDLDRAESSTLPFTGDRNRIARARTELNEFQRSMDAGYYNRRELNDSILAVQRVLDNSFTLSDYDRNLLIEDVSRMQDYRARLDEDGR